MKCDSKNRKRDRHVQPTKWHRELKRQWQTAWQPMLIALLCGLGATSSHGALAASAKMLKVFTKDVGGVTHFYVQNVEAAEVTATFDVHMTNLKSSAWIYAARALTKLSRYLRVLRSDAKTG